MRVVVAHNRYRSDVPSGENTIVEAEIAALSAAGIEVTPLIRSSDEIAGFGIADKALTAAGPLKNRDAVAELNRIIDAEQPDVLHVHNVYPLLSPSIIRTAHDRGVAVVHTVHNFRLDCVAGTYLRDGAICTDCSGRAVATPALQHGCYRGSRAQTIPMVMSRTAHRHTWELVDRFIALTTFHADFLRSIGVPRSRIVVRPTSVADRDEPSQAPGRDVLFVGRLGREKGVDVLLAAWRDSHAGRQGRKLRLVGDGELMADVRQAAASDPSIRVDGALDPSSVREAMRDAALVAIPSTCFEGFPLVLAEAASQGRGVMVSNHGGIGAVVNDTFGVKVTPGSVPDWADALRALDDADIARLGAGARAFYERALTPTRAIGSLLETYEAAINSRAALDA